MGDTTHNNRSAALPPPVGEPDIFDHAPVGMALLDPDGRVLRVNPAFCRVLGGDEEQFVGRKFPGGFFSSSSTGSGEVRPLVLGSQEHDYVDTAGRSTRVLVNISSCRAERDQAPYLIAQIQDVSEYKRLEAEKQKLVHDLQERIKELTVLHHATRLLQSDDRPAELLLEELVALLPAAWEYTDIAGARILFSDAVYATPRFSPDGLTQSARFTTAAGKRGTVEIAYRQEGPDRSKKFFLAEEAELLDSIAEMLKLYFDRTEAKRRVDEITKQLVERNRELWSLQQELGRVEQRAALGWMTGAIAHELGTPLNSVLGYTQLLAQEDLPDKARRHVKTIASQVQRMTAIVQYYLDRTRGSTTERSRINLNQLIKETLAWLDSVFSEKEIRVTTDLDESIPLVNAHAGSLQRVLINLLKNAVASIRDEGEIIVKTQTAPALEHQRPGINVQIIDTGSGIPSDLLPRVFDLFITTRPQGSGTGLGLAVSQEIIKEHGGKISISSQIDHGTTVSVFLPTGVEPSREM